MRLQLRHSGRWKVHIFCILFALNKGFKAKPLIRLAPERNVRTAEREKEK